MEYIIHKMLKTLILYQTSKGKIVKNYCNNLIILFNNLILSNSLDVSLFVFIFIFVYCTFILVMYLFVSGTPGRAEC